MMIEQVMMKLTHDAIYQIQERYASHTKPLRFCVFI